MMNKEAREAEKNTKLPHAKVRVVRKLDSEHLQGEDDVDAACATGGMHQTE